MAQGFTLADEFLYDIEEEELKEEEALKKEGAEDEDYKNDQQFSSKLDSIIAARGSSEYQELMASIRDPSVSRKRSEQVGLIGRCNQSLQALDQEALQLHNYIRDGYQATFSELATLVVDPLDYANTVACILATAPGATPALASILPSTTVLLVTIALSTATGVAPSDVKKQALARACAEVKEINEAKLTILSFIENQMTDVAPNLSTLVGTTVAAQLMIAAGGLQELSRLNSGAIQILGTKQKTLSGLSTATQIRHAGYIFDCDLIKKAPKEKQKQIVRVLTGRATLAARVDAVGSSKDASVGRKYRKEIEGKIQVWLQPPKARSIKALPVPGQKTKRTKRGGERARKRKALYAQTELRKQQNRRAFGDKIKDETLQDIMGNDLGMVGGSMGAGKLRVVMDDKGILKGLSKKRRLMMLKEKQQSEQHGMRTVGRASRLHASTTGGESSLALESDMGIELAPMKKMDTTDTKTNQYFGAASTFTQL